MTERKINMDPNTITLAQLGIFFLEVCGGIALIGGAGTWVLKVLGFIRAPEEKANSDYENIQELQKEMKILLAATLATIKHQLDGNDTKSLEKARGALEEYLINK